MTGNDWFFVQISDLQFGMIDPGAPDYAETALVSRAVEAINDLRPAFVLCTGDVVDVPASERQLEQAEELLGGLNADISLLTVPGNHDVGDAPTDETMSWFRRRVGSDRHAFVHRDWRFIGLNSCLLADGSRAPRDVEDQWSWLETELSLTTGTDGTILFMHHPLFLERPDEPQDYFNLPPEPRRRFLDLIRDHRVPLVLSGHLHRCHVTSYGTTQLVTAGPVGMPLGGGRSGLQIVRIAEEGIRHEFVALEDAVRR